MQSCRRLWAAIKIYVQPPLDGELQLIVCTIFLANPDEFLRGYEVSLNTYLTIKSSSLSSGNSSLKKLINHQLAAEKFCATTIIGW